MFTNFGIVTTFEKQNWKIGKNHNCNLIYLCFSGPSVLNKLAPFRFVTSNMTGQALWQTFVNQEDGEETDAPREEAIQDSLVSLV